MEPFDQTKAAAFQTRMVDMVTPLPRAMASARRRKTPPGAPISPVVMKQTFNSRRSTVAEIMAIEEPGGRRQALIRRPGGSSGLIAG
jgi:hypothetical protein